ncbi:MAG: hypothetical protein ACRCUQ_00315 [Alphaproteobacteria bacterium]
MARSTYVSFSLFLCFFLIFFNAFGKPNKVYQEDAFYPQITNRPILRATLITLALSSIFQQNIAAPIEGLGENFAVSTRNFQLSPTSPRAKEFNILYHILQNAGQIPKSELPCLINGEGRGSKKFLKPELRDTFIAYQLQKQLGKKAEGLSATEKKQLFLIRGLSAQEFKTFLVPRSSSYAFSSFFDSWLENSTTKQRCKLGRAASYLGMENIDFRGNKWEDLKKFSLSEKENLVEAFLFNEDRKSVKQWIQKGMPISPIQTLAEVFPKEVSDKKDILDKWSVIDRSKKNSPGDFDFFATQRSCKVPGKKVSDHGKRRVVADSVILSPKLPETNLESVLAEDWVSKGFSANYISANLSGNCTLVRWVNPGPYTPKLAKGWDERAIVVLAFVNEERALESCQLEHLKFITQGSRNISIAYLGSEDESEKDPPENGISNILDIRHRLQLAPLPLNPEAGLKPILSPFMVKKSAPVSRHRLRHANSRHQPPIFCSTSEK